MKQVNYVTYRSDPNANDKIREMNILFIDDNVAQEVLNMDDCLETVEDIYREYGLGWVTSTRARHYIPRSEGQDWYRWGAMAAGVTKLGVMAIRLQSNISVSTEGRVDYYAGTPGKWCELVLLFSTKDATPLAIMTGGHIQHMRVGATGGISVKYMAREDASTLGLFGTGGMATTHAWAIAKTRPIKTINVYSPNLDHREAFARQMTEDLGIPVLAQDNPSKVWEGADIVASCTNSRKPIIRGELLKPGMHVLSSLYQEMDDEVFRRCDRYVYSRPQTTEHYVAAPPENRQGVMGDHVNPDVDDTWLRRERLTMDEEKMASLSDVVLGKNPGRVSDEEITCFTSTGLAAPYTATAYKVYQLAKEHGLGRELPMSWFLQDIRS